MRLRNLILFSLLFISISYSYAQKNSIRGIVYDDATNEFLPGVTVVIEGTSTGTITDLDGKFDLSVDPGIYNIRVSFISYETLNIQNAEVQANAPLLLGELRLKEATVSLSAVTVTAKAIRNTETAMLSLKSKSANLIDGISAGSLKKIGDSDAAGAIKRVPGVSVSGGKYIFVRGLGDRYTKTNLNGVDIPGLDPDRNSIQMDIFPTSVVDNIIVHKSFSAELPADFTGGLIDIEVKDFPDKEIGKVNVSFGYNPTAHFNNEYLAYKGGGKDYLAYDDGSRAIPATNNIPQYAEVVGNPNGEAGLRYQEILSAFNPTMAAMQEKSFMDYGFGISYGNQLPKEKVTLGYNVSISYKNQTKFYKDAIDGRYGLTGDKENFELEQREFQKGDIGINNVLWSALGSFAIKSKKSKYRISLLRIQNGESKAGIFDFTGSDQGSDFNAFQHGLDYSQRSLTNLLLDGKHSFKEGKWKIVWKLSPTISKLEDPDVRFTRYEINPDNSVRIGTEVGFPERIWRDLDETNIAGLFHVTKSFNLNGNKSNIKFGAAHTYKQRDYIIRNFAINPRGDFPLTGDPNELFSKENLWPRNGSVGIGTTYETPFIPTNPNQYDASSNNTAGYVSSKLSLTEKFNAIIGIRMENFTQYYTGTDQLGVNVLESEEVLNNLDFFPTVNLLYRITKKQNLRFSFAQTIARPSFKELSFAEIYDPISGVTFIGGLHRDADDFSNVEYWDGNLRNSSIQNFDLRWEFFQKKGRMVSVSGFYKSFNNPIEMVQFTKQIGAFQPRNVGDGQVFGAELEFRQNLQFISSSMSSFRINANLTVTESSIQLSNTEFDSRVDNAREGQSIEEYRDMAGQSPYIINGGLSYSGANEGFWKRVQAGLYYNVQGTTLEFVGVADRPDIYSQPFHSLNFNSSIVLDKKKRVTMGLKVDNVLNSTKELIYKSFEANNRTFMSRKAGIKYTIKLSYTFK